MGYVAGDSLGKAKQAGITEPIAAFERVAVRGGLGFDDKISIKPQRHEYEEEPISIEMTPTWYAEIADAHAAPVSESDLEAWLRFKPRCDRVGVEWDDSFCDVELQKRLFAAKTEFDDIGQTKQFLEG